MEGVSNGGCEAFYDWNDQFAFAMKYEIRNYLPASKSKAAMVKLHKSPNMCVAGKPDERISEYMMLVEGKCYYNWYDGYSYRLNSCNNNELHYDVFIDFNCNMKKFEEGLTFQHTSLCNEATTISGMASGFSSFHCLN